MPSPPVVFGFLLATLYGALFHLIFGGSTRRLALYLLAGWLGFAIGQIFGTVFEVNALAIGVLNTFTATLGAWAALFITRFLSGRETKGQE
ncbi:MAG: hypothetical protein J7551_10050 [Chloroflexi bacterium]|jgi:uncharacterized membrane protein YeaQ/YmgE (transglycosylase-associated protein family)|nr:hypothetical protein [Chloroflexota bacterium]